MREKLLRHLISPSIQPPLTYYQPPRRTEVTEEKTIEDERDQTFPPPPIYPAFTPLRLD